MNYLAHAVPFVDDPYRVAGVATPDWLALTRPRLRCRSRHAAPHCDAADRDLASLAAGVVQHHADDDHFHQTPAFGVLSIRLAKLARQATRDADGARPGFLGHILVELLLDASIHAEQPKLLDRYYAALGRVDADKVAAGIGQMIGVDASQLAAIARRFVEIRFLYDYTDDDRLVMRLNQVMRRVRLPQLPPSFTSILPEARAAVDAMRAELLPLLAGSSDVRDASPAAPKGGEFGLWPRRDGAYDASS